MTDSQSYREILEFLNVNKRDLLVVQQNITEILDEIPKEYLSPKISTHLQKTNEDMEKILQSCEDLAVFWRTINDMSGGLQSQVVIDKLRVLMDTQQKFMRNLGISILKSNKSRPYMGGSFITSLNEQSWFELCSMLKSDENFLNAAIAMKNFHNELSKQQLTQELQQILKQHPKLSDSDKKEFSDLYVKSRIPIEEFIQKKYPDNSIPPTRLSSAREPIDSQEDFDGYKAYMQADDRELARMKRTGKYSAHKRGKKRKRSN
jgi:hypothetical protein